MKDEIEGKYSIKRILNLKRVMKSRQDFCIFGQNIYYPSPKR